MGLPDRYHRLHIAENRLVFLRADQIIELSTIDTGILFVFAEWSLGCQLSFSLLNDVLKEMPRASHIPLYVADTDHEETEKFIRQAGDSPAGYGETYWIKDGCILGRRLGAPDKDQVYAMREFTERLLSIPGK